MILRIGLEPEKMLVLLIQTKSETKQQKTIHLFKSLPLYQNSRKLDSPLRSMSSNTTQPQTSAEQRPQAGSESQSSGLHIPPEVLATMFCLEDVTGPSRLYYGSTLSTAPRKKVPFITPCPPDYDPEAPELENWITALKGDVKTIEWIRSQLRASLEDAREAWARPCMAGSESYAAKLDSVIEWREENLRQWEEDDEERRAELSEVSELDRHFRQLLRPSLRNATSSHF